MVEVGAEGRAEHTRLRPSTDAKVQYIIIINFQMVYSVSHNNVHNLGLRIGLIKSLYVQGFYLHK